MANRTMNSKEIQLFNDLMNTRAAISSAQIELEGFVRVLEALSTGILDNSPGIYDDIVCSKSERLRKVARMICTNAGIVDVTAGMLREIANNARTIEPTDDELGKY